VSILPDDAPPATQKRQKLGSRSRPAIMATMKTTASLAVLLLAACGAADAARTPTRAPATNVLFVGNSFTFWRGGLWRQLEALSDGQDPRLGYTTDCVVRGGASLEVMWERTKARARIADGAWDVVVLQEDLPETSVASFRNYAAKFVAAVRAAGARPVLYMTWAYDRLDWISFDEILAAHREVAAALEVEVAPVGLAWRLAREARPDLDMYGRDREHPSLAGCYLSLMVIEATISGLPPVAHDPDEVRLPGLERLEVEDARFLQRVAARAVSEWRAGV